MHERCVRAILLMNNDLCLAKGVVLETVSIEEE